MLSVTSRIESQGAEDVSIEAIVDGFEGMSRHPRPVLEFGIYHDGGKQQGRSVELEPGRAIDGRIVVREAFVVPDEYQFSVGIRRTWQLE